MTASTGERVLSPGDLGWRLQVVRAAIWTAAAAGDPYALLLRGQEDDPTPWLRRARARGPVHRSALTAWVVADPDLGADVLSDGRFGPRQADGSPHGLQILPLDEAGLNHESRPLPVDRADIQAACERILGGWGEGPHDLVADYARPVTEAVVALALDLSPDVRARLSPHWRGLGLALDALATPPALAPTRELYRAVRAARALLDTPAPAVACAATMPTAVARAILGLPRRPPARLHARVAHEPLRLSTVDIAAGDQVVVLDDGPSLIDVAGLHWTAAAPLLRLATEVATSVFDLPVRPAGPALFARRAPVTGALLSVPVTVDRRRG